jgi:muramoyltetrapeptide carboxypeptidase
VACGEFTACGDPDLVQDVLTRRLAPLGVPLVRDLPVGHGEVNRTVPLGRLARLDGATGTLSPVS